MNLNEFVLNQGKDSKRKRNRPLTNNIQIGAQQYPKDSTLSTKTICETSTSKKSSKSPYGSSKSSNDAETKIIIAITEGRGSAQCEIGMAIVDVYKPNLVLCQISDVHSYINTLTKINYFNPHEILVPSTFDKCTNNRLIEILKSNFPHMKITAISRSVFSKNSGLEFIRKLCITEFNSIVLLLEYKYYALAAVSALITYIQDGLNVYYSAGTIKVKYEESEGHTVIDISTVDNLELIASTRPAQCVKFSNLFSILNRCCTKIGARALRSAILQPLYNVVSINERLDCVQCLQMNRNLHTAIQEILQKIPNIDQLLTIGTLMPEQANNCSNRHINYVILLNQVLEIIQPLGDVLEEIDVDFFSNLRSTLKGTYFNDIKQLLANEISPNAEANATQSKGQQAILQKCFVIKAGVSGVLDLARRHYTERLEDMQVYVKMLAHKYGLPLSLNNNNTRSYHIVMTLNQQQKRFMKNSDLPVEFIEVSRTASTFTMKTVDLVNMATRLNEIVTQVLRLSNIALYAIVTKLKRYIGLFYTLVEEISYLDMIQSLATATSGANYVRPTFKEFTHIENSTHPLLEHILPEKPQTNPIECSKYHNFHIITGPNGSGKSIYIRQVLLLQVMAQIGCFVPAKEATFRPSNRIFSRIYLEDRMECGTSSFVLEMCEIKYILNTLTDDSLVVIDELCRSTSVEEGTALAMAISEKLLHTNAFIYLTTHYTLITKLADIYCNVKIWNLKTDDDRPENGKLHYKHILEPGVTKIERYALYMIENLWPQTLLQNIYKSWDGLEKTKTPRPIGQLPKSSFVNGYDKLAQFHTKSNASISMDNSCNISQLNENVLRPEMEIVDKSADESNYNVFAKPLVDSMVTSTPIVMNPKRIQNVVAADFDMESIHEDLMEFSRHLEEEESNSPFGENENHIWPVVTVIEGPNNKTMSFNETNCEITEDETLPTSSTDKVSSSQTMPTDNSTKEGDLQAKSSTTEAFSRISKDRNLTANTSSKNVSVETSSKAVSSVKSKPLLKQRRGKFIPPKKLTRREIEQDFFEQDKRFLESNDDVNSPSYVNFVKQVMNRPTVQQLQNCQHLVRAQRTISGEFKVVEYEQPTVKKQKTMLKCQNSGVQFNATIFSDQNAEVFQEYLNSKEKDYTKFNFNFSNNEQRNKILPPNEALADVFCNMMRAKALSVTSTEIFYKENANEMEIPNARKYQYNSGSSTSMFAVRYPSDEDLEI